MIRIPLGQNISVDLYIEYTIWLLEHGLSDSLHYYPECKAYLVDFRHEEDAVAFKLRFQ